MKRHKWLAVLAVTVCLAAQAFVVVPHHHHDRGETPCFNIVHCIEHNAAHDSAVPDGCCHDHCAPESEPAGGHDCSIKVDVAELVNTREYRVLIDVISALNDFYAPEPVIVPEYSDTEPFFTLTRRRQMPDVRSVCALYLAEAHPARAPSVFV